MRLQRIEIKDVGRKGSHRVLDLTTVPEGLVAITGDNGAGKTTLLEASCPGALFRSLPSRHPGGLVDVAVGRAAVIEARYEHDGSTWTARHLLDGDHRRAEAHLYRDGVPATMGDHTSNGKARVFDRLVGEVWPSWTTVAASRFWVQGGGGSWASLTPTQRRAMLRELLGLEQYQRIAEQAKHRAAAAAEALAGLEQRDEQARQAAVEIERLQAHVAETQSAVTDAELRVQEASALVGRLEEELDRARAAEAVNRAAELRARRQNLEQQITQTEADLADATVSAQAARERLVSAQERVAKAMDAYHARDAEVRAWRAADGDAARAEERVEQLRRSLPSDASISPEAAEAQVVRIRQELSDLQARASERAKLLERVRSVRTAAQRARGTVQELAAVPCGGEGEFASCGLIASAVRARNDLGPLQEELAALEQQVAGMEDVQEQIIATSQTLDRATDIQRRAITASQQLARLEQAVETARMARARVPTPAPVPMERPSTVEADQAQRAFVEADGRRQMLAGRLLTLQTDLHHLPAPPPVDGDASSERTSTEVQRDLDAARQRVTAAAARHRDAQRQADQAEADLRGTQRVAPQAPDPEELSTARATLDRWSRIHAAAGPRGVQAVLVDHAGPAISETANELLAAAYGDRRFEIEIQTTQAKRDGSGDKDVLEVVVHDAERGEHGALDNLSGGEIDMVRAALSLGVAEHHGRMSGAWETAWADEAGAALTSENAGRWVTMLRMAAQRMGIRHMLIVSHDENVQRACDTIIDVRDLEVGS